MREVVFRRVPGVGSGRLPDGSLPTESGSVCDLVKAVPYLIGPDIPPIGVLNQVLGSGRHDAGMSGGAIWEPFELSSAEYEELVEELQRLGTSHGRFGWGSFELLEPPGSVHTYTEYVNWRSETVRARREISEDRLREQLNQAERELERMPTENESRATERQMKLWEAQTALAEYLVARWNRRLPDRASLDQLLDVMQHAGGFQKRLWLAEHNQQIDEAAALRDEFRSAQRTASRLLNSL